MHKLPFVSTPVALALFVSFAAPIPALAELPLLPPVDPSLSPPAQPVAPRTTPQAGPRLAPSLAVEPDGASAVSASTSPFAPAAGRLPSAASVLTAPVTLNASGSADAFTATHTGSGRAVSGVVNNGGNALSAVKGQTNGSGAGVNGVNTGTTGSSGKFQMTNASSAQPGVTSTNAGTGSAILGVMGSAGTFDTAAVLGQHNMATGWGIGVEGDGGYMGVRGSGASYGVFGLSTAGSGIGVYGSSSTSTGVYGSSASSTGVNGVSNSGYGVYGNSSSYFGVYGKAASGPGVYAESDSGYGIFAKTNTGSYAAVFYGAVFSNAAMYATSYNSSSDRAVKQDFRDIDGNDVLQRIEAMPIGGWDFQAAPGIHHIGPMAQDFRAAFGLGVDDKHIDMTDGLGVSLAAIQALKRQLDQKEESNAQLRARVATLETQAARAQAADDAIDRLSARLATLERTAQAAVSVPAATQP